MCKINKGYIVRNLDFFKENFLKEKNLKYKRCDNLSLCVPLNKILTNGIIIKNLQISMKKFCKKLRNEDGLKIFLNKVIFNCSEVKIKFRLNAKKNLLKNITIIDKAKVINNEKNYCYGKSI